MAIKEVRVDPVKVPGSFVRLQGAYSGLRAAEQRVADFILRHPDELIYLTVTELAERTSTSESTVVRLQGLPRVQDRPGARSGRADDRDLRGDRAGRRPLHRQVEGLPG